MYTQHTHTHSTYVQHPHTTYKHCLAYTCTRVHTAHTRSLPHGLTESPPQMQSCLHDSLLCAPHQRQTNSEAREKQMGKSSCVSSPVNFVSNGNVFGRSEAARVEASWGPGPSHGAAPLSPQCRLRNPGITGEDSQALTGTRRAASGPQHSLSLGSWLSFTPRGSGGRNTLDLKVCSGSWLCSGPLSLSLPSVKAGCSRT